MPELIIDFNDTPEGTFRGDGQIPAPVVFLRAFNDEHQPVVTSGPLTAPEPTEFGPVTRIEDLAAVHDRTLMLHAPGAGGFQTVQQAFGTMRCPHLRMEVETTIPMEQVSERKWPAWWLIPEDEYERIGGNLSTACDPDFITVVQNRLPQIPRNSIMWRPQGSPLGGLAWLVQFTGADGRPSRRNHPWERIDAHGSLHEQRVEVRGSNLRLLAFNGTAWDLVLEEHDIIPPDWVEKRIVFLFIAADYESWDAGKGDGHGPAVRMVDRVRFRAPEVGLLVGSAPAPEPPPEHDEPHVEEPVHEDAPDHEDPPVEPEPSPPVAEDLRPGLQRARELIDGELDEIERLANP